MITSAANDKVKHARSLNLKKNRAAFRQFSVEGTRVIEEGERAGIIPALVFFDPAFVAGDARAGGLVKRLQARTREVHAVTRNLLHALAQTENPQGIVAVYSFSDLPLPPDPSFVLILDAIRDPGNEGTILRTAWAAGVDAVLLAPGTADPYNPKIVTCGNGCSFLPSPSLSVVERDCLDAWVDLACVPGGRGWRSDLHVGRLDSTLRTNSWWGSGRCGRTSATSNHNSPFDPNAGNRGIAQCRSGSGDPDIRSNEGQTDVITRSFPVSIPLCYNRTISTLFSLTWSIICAGTGRTS